MSYSKLQAHFGRIGHLDEVAAIVEWDQAVNMPETAGEGRARAMAGLMRTRHELLTQPQLADWLAAAEQESDLGAWENANLREMRRWYRRASAVPGELVEAASQAEKTSEQAWRRYRAENDFAHFAPYLEQVVRLKREVGSALAETLGCSAYEALMDEYEPEARTELIDEHFAELGRFLPGFTQRVLERQRETQWHRPRGPFPIEQQRALAWEMMKVVGFHREGGRLDISHHPFCGGVSHDVRITTRYDEADFTSALMGVLHEAGHGKYEQGLPRQWLHQPVGAARGMVLHESQSLLLEMQVCRGSAFLQFMGPRIRAAFAAQAASQPEAYTQDNLCRLYTRVQPGLIRVDADEVTYPAHIVLRYELEKALLAGQLEVRDLPEAWNARMVELLGLSTLGNDKDGCMQDVHWPSGAFGYFPLYTLGALVAAQLYEAARTAHPELTAALREGHFETLNQWLGQHVWSRASLTTTSGIVEAATGGPLGSQAFINHLQQRYLPQG